MSCSQDTSRSWRMTVDNCGVSWWSQNCCLFGVGNQFSFKSAYPHSLLFSDASFQVLVDDGNTYYTRLGNLQTLLYRRDASEDYISRVAKVDLGSHILYIRSEISGTTTKLRPAHRSLPLNPYRPGHHSQAWAEVPTGSRIID
jgi:hypothetical protein